MMGHEHEWSPYKDAPFGEMPGRLWQCASCGAVGYVRTHTFNPRRFKADRVTPYVCGVSGCSKLAVLRLKGRCGPNNTFRWRCGEHRSVGAA